MLQTNKEIDEEMERDAVVPETMAEIVLAQLQAMLTLEEQEVLKVASVAGVHFNLQLIQYLCASQIKKVLVKKNENENECHKSNLSCY